MLLSGATAAWAEEPWEVVDVPRVPRTPGAVLAQSLSVGRTTRWFGDAVVGGSATLDLRKRIGVGGDLTLGAFALTVPDEDRGALLGRPFGADAWLWFASRRPATLHAITVRFALPTDPTGTTWLWELADGAGRLGLDYVGNLDGEHVDVRLDGGGGVDVLGGLEAHGSVAVLIDVADGLAVAVGGTVDVGPWWARAGLRWRPVPGLELGLDGSARVYVPVEWGNVPEGEWPVVPTLTVKGFEAQPSSAPSPP